MVSRKERRGRSSTYYERCESFFLEKTLKIILVKFVGTLGLRDTPKRPLSKDFQLQLILTSIRKFFDHMGQQNLTWGRVIRVLPT